MEGEMSRWNSGNIGREPVTLSAEIEDIWEHEDELRTGEVFGRLKVERLIPWQLNEPSVLISVTERTVYGSNVRGIYDAEDWPLLCAWERYDQDDHPGGSDDVKPKQARPQPLLAP
jgi:hypothetical protein